MSDYAAHTDGKEIYANRKAIFNMCVFKPLFLLRRKENRCAIRTKWTKSFDINSALRAFAQQAQRANWT